MSGGTLAGAIAAMGLAGGNGGLIGCFTGQVDWRSSCSLSPRADGSLGNLYLWVRTRDVLKKEKRASEILSKTVSVRSAHLHALPAAA